MGHLRNCAALAIACAVTTLVAGCGRGATAEIRDLGISIKLPEGWKQGEPKAAGGFYRSADGHFFFENGELDDPSGDAMSFPLEAPTLSESVDKLISETEKMESMQAGMLKALTKAAGGSGETVAQAESQIRSKVLSRTPQTISGHEAIVVVTQAERSTVAAYVLAGDKVIAVTFGAEKANFPKYEQTFKDAIATVKVK